MKTVSSVVGFPWRRDWFNAAAGGLVFATAMASFFMRPLDLLVESTWTVYGYHFCTVLIAPLLAGLGAWAGLRHSRAEELARSWGREGSVVALVWLRMMVWVASAYVVGLGVVIAASKAQGTPGFPSARILFTAVPALALVGAALAAGIVLGWATRHWAVVAVAPICVFGLIIFAYSVHMSFVRVGGATASLVGLEPRLDIGVLQAVMYAAVTVAFIAWAGRRTFVGSAILAVATVAVVACVVGLLGRPADTLEEVPVSMRCTDEVVRICLSDEYEQFRRPLQEGLDPVLRAFAEAGAPIPTEFTQSFERQVFGLAAIPGLHRMTRDPDRVIIGSITNAYMRACNTDNDELLEARTVVGRWVDESYDAVQRGEGVSMEPSLEAAFEVLKACSG